MANEKTYEQKQRYEQSLYSSEMDLWNCSKLEEAEKESRMYRIMERMK